RLLHHPRPHRRRDQRRRPPSGHPRNRGSDPEPRGNRRSGRGRGRRQAQGPGTDGFRRGQGCRPRRDARAGQGPGEGSLRYGRQHPRRHRPAGPRPFRDRSAQDPLRQDAAPFASGPGRRPRSGRSDDHRRSVDAGADQEGAGQLKPAVFQPKPAAANRRAFLRPLAGNPAVGWMLECRPVLPSGTSKQMIYETVAAVDLGSNSFRLQVGRVVDDQIYTLDSMKEPVRLASGLTADKVLDAPSQARALEALRRFGERLRGLDSGAVRVVATNTLRVAKNATEFLPQAEAALGFPIEIIAGREEARLIYIGASHSLPMAAHKRLVVDIGGGSTEFIIGKRHDPQLMESLYMGCVSYTLRFFPDRKIDKKRLREAQVAAAKEI